MVRTTRCIEAVSDISGPGGDKLYKFNAPLSLKREQVLETAVQNTMVGILAQLAALANYAGDIFVGLVKESNSTYQRISGLTQKVSDISKLAPVVENYWGKTTPERMYQTPRIEFSLPLIQDAQLFTSDSMPKALQDSYKKSYPPPNLAKMDPFMDDNKKCLELYTNPRFFLDEWIAEQKKLREANREERRRKRLERKQQKEKDSKGAAPKQVKHIQKYIFDPNTGEKILVKREEEVTPTASASLTGSGNTMRDKQSFQTGQISGFYSESAAPPAGMEPPPPPPSEDFFSAPPPPPPDEFSAPPPPPRSSSLDNVSPAGGFYEAGPPASSRPRDASREAVSYTPPPPPPREGYVPPPPGQRVPPPPPAAPDAPPPPPVPAELMAAAGAASGAGGFAAALASKQLRKTEPSTASPVKKVDARSTLMESIQKGLVLKSATERKIEKTTGGGSSTTAATPNSVAEILARRIAIVGSDSEEDESDEEWS